MKRRQVELISPKHGCMIVWVDASLKLTPGVSVSGKDGKMWIVKEVYSTLVDDQALNRKWEVGGL